MQLEFGAEQYRMSSRLANYPTIGKIVSKYIGSTNVGQFARADIFKRALRKLPTHTFKTILDLGCGQGEYAFMVAKALPASQLTALDIESQRLDKIATIASSMNHRNLSTHHGKIDSLPSNRTFDFIYSIDVFEHILAEEMPFQQVHDHLNNGGYFFIKMPSKNQISVLPNQWFEDHSAWLEEEHIGQVYELDDLCKRLIDTGFVVEQKNYADGALSRLSWELAYLSKKAGPIVQLLALPLLKGFMLLDHMITRRNKGNTIQVIAKKQQS